MTNIRKAIDDLIDAADILVNRRDHVTGDVALIPRTSISRLERALEQAQKAMEESRPVIRDTRVVEVRCLYEELEEIEHIAAEMAEALDAAGEVLDHMRIDDAPVTGPELRDKAQRAFGLVLRAQQRWREEQS
jgi:precorrin isomerase